MADIQSLLQLEDSYDFVLNLSFGDSKFLTQVIIYPQMRYTHPHNVQLHAHHCRVPGQLRGLRLHRDQAQPQDLLALRRREAEEDLIRYLASYPVSYLINEMYYYYFYSLGLSFRILR